MDLTLSVSPHPSRLQQVRPVCYGVTHAIAPSRKYASLVYFCIFNNIKPTKMGPECLHASKICCVAMYVVTMSFAVLCAAS
jgi:hypothetical protein